MSYFSPEEQNQMLDVAAQNPIGKKSDAGFFDGAFTAPFKGLYAGITQADQVAWAGVDTVVTPIARAVNDSLGVSDTSESFIKEQRKLAERQVRLLTPDPGTTGTAGQVLFSLSQMGGQAVAGSLLGGLPGAAATVGTLQGFSDYEKSIAGKVDFGTAVDKALVTGGTAALGAILPMSLGLRAGGVVAEGVGSALASSGRGAGNILSPIARAAPDVFYSAGANVTMGMAQRGLSADVLRRGGYPEMAQQYDVMDRQSLATDAILGIAFGGLGRFINSRGESVPVRNVTSEEVSAALTTSSHLNREVTVSPGVPVNVLSRDAHAAAMNKAMSDIMAGHSVDVGSLLDGAQFLQKSPKQNLSSTAVREALGLYDEGATARILEEENLSSLASQVIPRSERNSLRQDIHNLEYSISKLEEQRIDVSSRRASNSSGSRIKRNELTQINDQIKQMGNDLAIKQKTLSDSSPGGRFYDARSELSRRQGEQAEIEASGLSFFSTPKPRPREMVAQDTPINTSRGDRGERGDNQGIDNDIRDAERAVTENPDLEVHVINPDDSTAVIKASDLMDAANRDIENAKNDASLFEVAVSCFLRR
ncbi:hypothetical protein [Pectobacterium odoriferum]|uniref:hypothetical protein n=1 Tax=Pectobacterium odoriferum TaxID=78398 RepID=UPI0005040A12|nr:hypothetical protein [Pectobacterium odoriferum]KGA30235.1 hypothetical protein KS43_20340 [Pectobacterium odoriferum]